MGDGTGYSLYDRSLIVKSGEFGREVMLIRATSIPV